jgi:hypothetical protein
MSEPLRLSVRQTLEVARMLDRNGDGVAEQLNGAVTVWFRNVAGELDRAVTLDHEGRIVARRRLDLLRPEPEDDLDDLSDEQPVLRPEEMEPKRPLPAPHCKCERPVWDRQSRCCVWCGKDAEPFIDPAAEPLDEAA